MFARANQRAGSAAEQRTADGVVGPRCPVIIARGAVRVRRVIHVGRRARRGGRRVVAVTHARCRRINIRLRVVIILAARLTEDGACQQTRTRADGRAFTGEAMATISADDSTNQAAPERAAEGFRAEQLRLRGKVQSSRPERQNDLFHNHRLVRRPGLVFIRRGKLPRSQRGVNGLAFRVHAAPAPPDGETPNENAADSICFVPAGPV